MTLKRKKVSLVRFNQAKFSPMNQTQGWYRQDLVRPGWWRGCGKEIVLSPHRKEGGGTAQGASGVSVERLGAANKPAELGAGGAGREAGPARARSRAVGEQGGASAGAGPGAGAAGGWAGELGGAGRARGRGQGPEPEAGPGAGGRTGRGGAGRGSAASRCLGSGGPRRRAHSRGAGRGSRAAAG